MEASSSHSFDGNKITSAGVSLLLEACKKNNSTIKKISFHRNELDDKCMSDVGDFIKSNASIKFLDLGENRNISDEGVNILLSSLHGNKTFNYLSFAGCNKITDKSFLYIINATKSSSLLRIYLAGTSIAEKNQSEIERHLFKSN